MAFGASLHASIRPSYPDKTITLATADTREELTNRLGAIKTLHERYRVIMIVAHSNATRPAFRGLLFGAVSSHLST